MYPGVNDSMNVKVEDIDGPLHSKLDTLEDEIRQMYNNSKPSSSVRLGVNYDQASFGKTDEPIITDTKRSHQTKSQASSRSNVNVESRNDSKLIEDEDSPPRQQNFGWQDNNQSPGFPNRERATGQDSNNIPSIDNQNSIGQVDRDDICKKHIMYCYLGPNPFSNFDTNRVVEMDEQSSPQRQLNFNYSGMNPLGYQIGNPYAQVRDIEDRTIQTQTGPSLKTIEIVQQTYVKMEGNNNPSSINNSKRSQSSIGKNM